MAINAERRLSWALMTAMLALAAAGLVMWHLSPPSTGIDPATHDHSKPASTQTTPPTDLANQSVDLRPRREETEASDVQDQLRVLTIASSTPVANVAGRVTRPFGTGFPACDLATLGQGHCVAAGSTDEHGLFVCNVAQGVRVLVDAGAPSGARRTASARGGDEVVLDMTAAGEVAGQIVRQRDSSPVEGMMILGYRDISHDADPQWTARPDAAGRFSIAVGVGRYEVEARKHGEEWGRYKTIEVRNGQALNLLWELRDPRHTRGRVVMRGTGQPIMNAIVAPNYLRRGHVTTDARGHFELTGFPNAVEETLYVWAPGVATTRFHVASTETETAAELTLEVPEQRSLHGIVLTDAGQPLADAYVAAVSTAVGPISSWRTGTWAHRTGEPLWTGMITAGDGRFAIQGLNASDGYRLVCSRAGYGTIMLDIGQLDTAPDTAVDAIVMQAACRIKGNVKARGIERSWNVRLSYPVIGASKPARPFPRAHALSQIANQRNLYLQRPGPFTFDDLAPGSYTVCLSVNGNQMADAHVVLERPGDVAFVDLTSEQMTRLTIRLEAPPDIGRILVSARDRQGREIQSGIAARGACSMDLPAGDYRLVVSESPRGADYAAVDVRLNDKEVNVQMPRLTTAQIRGRVVDTMHKPVAGARVWVQRGLSSTSPATLTTAAGEFALAIEAGAVVDVFAAQEAGASLEAAARASVLPEHAGVTRGVRSGEVDVLVIIKRSGG